MAWKNEFSDLIINSNCSSNKVFKNNVFSTTRGGCYNEYTILNYIIIQKFSKK